MKPDPRDIDRLMQVMERAFDPVWREAWTRRQVEDALQTGYCDYALIDATGKDPDARQSAAGFYLARHLGSEAELLLLGVEPQFRGRKLGKLLLEQLARVSKRRGARRLFLEMRRGNSAERLYRAFGFVPVGERPRYYTTTDGQKVDAITFALSLDEPA